MKFYLTQYKWGRKLYTGTWYYNYKWITMPFWTDKIITSCGSRNLKIEHYG